jgi:hypothetical protein
MYFKLLGEPSSLSYEDLSINQLAVTKVLEPIQILYDEAIEGSQYEVFLKERVADLSSYLIACMTEQEERREKDNPCKSAQHQGQL